MLQKVLSKHLKCWWGSSKCLKQISSHQVSNTAEDTWFLLFTHFKTVILLFVLLHEYTIRGNFLVLTYMGFSKNLFHWFNLSQHYRIIKWSNKGEYQSPRFRGNWSQKSKLILFAQVHLCWNWLQRNSTMKKTSVHDYRWVPQIRGTCKPWQTLAEQCDE